MRQAVWQQLEAYRRASATPTAAGKLAYSCDCCGRRVADGRKLRLLHVEPSFNQVCEWVLRRGQVQVDGQGGDHGG